MSTAEVRIGERAGLRLIAAAKPGGGTRWLTRLDPDRARAYEACVARVSPAIEAALSPPVVSDRVRDPGTLPLRLEPWRTARDRFVRRVGDLSKAGALARADVRDCFGAITPTMVDRGLRDLGCERSDCHEIVGLLQEMAAHGVRGLPVGPVPSAVLANAVLEPADRALTLGGIRHVRWVDDFMIAAADADWALRSLEVVRSAVAAIGLELCGRKTRVLEVPDGVDWEPSGSGARI